MKISKTLAEGGLYLAWATALASMLGSLYFSEVLKIAPCILCWYQRIAMYPLVLIIGTGILKRDKNFSIYAIPLAVIGGLIALYQNLLVWHVFSESLAPCTFGVSCVEQNFVVLNFVTIPLLSLISFVLITLLMFAHRSAQKNV